MATLEEFGAWAISEGNQVPIRANETKKAVTRVVAADLIEVTPVDISTALSNWQVGIGGAPLGPIPAYVEGSFGSTEKASESIAIEQAELYIHAAEPGESVFISNKVEYITKLNEGSSRQAPANFVERSVLLGESFVRRNGLVKGIAK
jgi:hypothetical protein